MGVEGKEVGKELARRQELTAPGVAQVAEISILQLEWNAIVAKNPKSNLIPKHSRQLRTVVDQVHTAWRRKVTALLRLVGERSEAYFIQSILLILHALGLEKGRMETGAAHNAET
jgi:hypothetical protein